jgi:hypothetical protein
MRNLVLDKSGMSFKIDLWEVVLKKAKQRVGGRRSVKKSPKTHSVGIFSLPFLADQIFPFI